MMRVLTRTALAVVLCTLAILYSGPLAECIRIVRGLGLENLICVSALAVVVLVPLLELCRFFLRPQREFAVLGQGKGVIPAMASSPEQGMSVERRARHEAAHTVVALALGQVNLSADVHVRGHVGGTVHHEHPANVRLADGLFVGMTVAVAGFVADVDDGVHDEGSSSDIAMAQRHALSILSAGDRQGGAADRLTSDHLLQEATRAARSIISRERRALEAIAAALVERTHLDDAALRSFGVLPRRRHEWKGLEDA